LAGSPATFQGPSRIVITESRANEYFGHMPVDAAIGKEIIYNDSLRLIVAGVVKDWNDNSDFPFTDFISLSTVKNSILGEMISLDNGTNTMVFIKLSKDISSEAVSQQFDKLMSAHSTEERRSDYYLQPLTSIHFTDDANYGDGAFHFDGDKFRKVYLPTLYKLAGSALFILFIALINFVNLFSAMSIQRMKEIGVRKSLGGLPRNLFLQILCETLLQTLFAVICSLLLVSIVFSALDRFIPDGVEFYTLDIETFLFLFLITVTTSVIATIYPVKVLSSYPAVLSLKGIKGSSGSKGTIRKVMITFQFAISLMFIIGAIVINSQLQFIREETKLTKAPILNIRAGHKVKLFSDKVKQLPGVASAAIQGIPPVGLSRMLHSVQNESSTTTITNASIKMGDENFIPLYEIQFLAGRNISENDSIKEFVINESYSKVLGAAKPEDALNKVIYFDGVPYSVVGVVENFHEGSFHEVIGPVAIGRFPQWENRVAIKLDLVQNQGMHEIVDQIEREWKELFPDNPFEYTFLDDSIKVLYQKETDIAYILNCIMGTAIFLSCMGVFGLAMFNAQVKTKEIGVRKVLGASTYNIVILFCKEFMLLVLIALVVASPTAWYFTGEWLDGFAYRVSVEWWIFPLAGAVTFLTALISGGSQAIKAAIANPVQSLRSE
jgi:putative ABC transport system permease protein